MGWNQCTLQFHHQCGDDCGISWWGRWNSIDFYILMNIFKGLFDILSHHLIEGLRIQKLQCIIDNLLLGLWSNGSVNFFHKISRFFVSNGFFWKNQILSPLNKNLSNLKKVKVTLLQIRPAAIFYLYSMHFLKTLVWPSLE